MQLRRAAIGFVAIASSSTGHADDPEQQLAKQSRNPLSDLIALPIDIGFTSGGRFEDRALLAIDLQPTIPVPITPSADVITRIDVPVVSAPHTASGRELGFGDIELRALATPARPRPVTWGVGPILSFPTATLDVISTGSWAFGVAAAGVLTTRRWVIGTTASQLWTVTDYGDRRRVDRFALEPIVAWSFSRGWMLETAPVITADWNAADDGWVVPAGGGVTWTTVLDDQAMTLGVHYYARLRDGDDEHQVRFEISLLYPKAYDARRHHATTALE